VGQAEEDLEVVAREQAVRGLVEVARLREFLF
jgi:hypothetical protein